MARPRPQGCSLAPGAVMAPSLAGPAGACSHTRRWPSEWFHDTVLRWLRCPETPGSAVSHHPVLCPLPLLPDVSSVSPTPQPDSPTSWRRCPRHT